MSANKRKCSGCGATKSKPAAKRVRTKNGSEVPENPVVVGGEEGKGAAATALGAGANSTAPTLSAAWVPWALAAAEAALGEIRELSAASGVVLAESAAALAAPAAASPQVDEWQEELSKGRVKVETELVFDISTNSYGGGSQRLRIKQVGNKFNDATFEEMEKTIIEIYEREGHLPALSAFHIPRGFDTNAFLHIETARVPCMLHYDGEDECGSNGSRQGCGGMFWLRRATFDVLELRQIKNTLVNGLLGGVMEL